MSTSVRVGLPETTFPATNTPLMVIPDYTPFQLRKAALEAACAVQGSQSVKVFVSNLEAFEAYLKDGTKP